MQTILDRTLCDEPASESAGAAEVLDLGAAAPTWLACYTPTPQTSENPPAVSADPRSEIRPVWLFGRPWAIVAHPAIGSPVTSSADWCALVGLVITAAATLCARLVRGNQHMLERHVRERTLALVQREHDLATTLNSIGDAVIATDLMGRITRLNPVAEQLTGWDRASAVGASVRDVLRMVEGPDRVPHECPIEQRVLRDGVVIETPDVVTLIGRDGQEHDVAHTLAPIRDGNGAIRGAVIVLRDISRETAARRALQESERLYRTIVDTSPDGLLIARAATRELVYANPAAARMFRASGGVLGSGAGQFCQHSLGGRALPRQADLPATRRNRVHRRNHRPAGPDCRRRVCVRIPHRCHGTLQRGARAARE